MDADVLIIGSGQAGVPLATRLAKAGKKVVLVERKELGGTCINVGCTPTKTMVASARAAHVARTAGRLGVHAGEVRVDFPAVIDRKDSIVRQWRQGVENRVKQAGVVLVRGHARFVGLRRVEVAGEVHSAPTVIVNTGARGVEPTIDGLSSVPWLHNGTLMELRELPTHLVVLGGGYIGCEFAQMFRRFGARITIVDRAAHLLGREDPDISAEVEKAFREEGIELKPRTKVARIEGKQGDVAVHVEGGGEARGSHLLVAVGRRPNTDDLGCDKGGIDLDDKGAIRVDDRYRTSDEGTYAVGDVTGGPQFTHTSWDDHRILFDILMGQGKRGRSGRHVPSPVLTDPQRAGAGLTRRRKMIALRRAFLVASCFALSFAAVAQTQPAPAGATQQPQQTSDDAIARLIDDLVAANRILVDQGVLDGYGHVSVRSPRDPTHFYMARSIAPELVTAKDVLEYDLSGEPVEAKGVPLFIERFIHSEIYKARPDVMAVAHNHAPSLIPFGV